MFTVENCSPRARSWMTPTATGKEYNCWKSCEYFIARKSVEQLQPACLTLRCCESPIKNDRNLWFIPALSLYIFYSRARRIIILWFVEVFNYFIGDLIWGIVLSFITRWCGVNMRLSSNRILRFVRREINCYLKRYRLDIEFSFNREILYCWFKISFY